MKLFDTQFGQKTVELTYADNPQLDDALTLVIVRMPLEDTETKSLAWHRLRTLSQARDVIGAEMQRLKSIIDGV